MAHEQAYRQSVLPNSSAEILRPMDDGLRVHWHSEMDLHVLYRNGQRIAGHHNGFSCHELAKRILAANPRRAIEQFDYIRACGGKHYITHEEFAAMCDVNER
ncbi:hypothetical protein KAJ83_01510 [Marivibrio halodurans]|uniref:Uncharacterized protein n=1 Tax=Marivibrio halodurans TaxID=2039722 RepID=A0A8J7S2U1_9PROT|nr:hypothetical protein [Marivibrio halodurans]MBP5855669.1 hypothetical protein [Marivibrio halodurans]